MSSKFWYLTKQSFKKKAGSKWFIGINILLAILIIALININSIIAFFGGDFNETTNIIVLDQTDVSYPILKEAMTTIIKEEELENINIKESDKTEKKLTKDLKDSEVVVVLNNDTTSYVTAKIISNEKINFFVS